MRGVRVIAYACALTASACVDLSLPTDTADAGADVRPPPADAGDAGMDMPAVPDRPQDMAGEDARPDAVEAGIDAPADSGVDAPAMDAQDAPPDMLPSTLSGLVGYWKLDDRSAALVQDSSGLGNDGTVMGSPTLVTSGLPGLMFPDPGAFLLSGQNDAVVVPDQPGSTSLQPARISISVWVKLASLTARSTCGGAPSTDQYIVHRRNTRGAAGNFEAFALMKYESGTFGFLLATNAGQADAAKGLTLAQTGVWYHLVGTFDGSGVIQLYVNGSFEGSHSHSYPIDYDPTRPLFVGRTGECAPNGEGDATWDARLNGTIDDLRIYDRVLTLDEITRLARGTN